MQLYKASMLFRTKEHLAVMFAFELLLSFVGLQSDGQINDEPSTLALDGIKGGIMLKARLDNAIIFDRSELTPDNGFCIGDVDVSNTWLALRMIVAGYRVMTLGK